MLFILWTFFDFCFLKLLWHVYYIIFPLVRAMTSSFLRFLDHTVGGTPLDEWSARRRDFYLTTNKTHNRQISILPPTSGGIRTHDLSRRAGADLQTYALDRATTGTGMSIMYLVIIVCFRLSQWRRPKNSVTCRRTIVYCVLLYLIIVKLPQYVLRIALLHVKWIIFNNCHISQIQVGRSRVQFPMVSSEFFIDIVLPPALWPWGWLSL